MTPALWREVIAIFLRYAAPLVVGLIAGYMSEEDQKRLVDIMTSPEFALMAATTGVSLYLGIRHWLKGKRTAMTAAAMGQPVSLAVAAEVAKTSAPLLSTPTTVTPTLSGPAPEEAPPPASESTDSKPF